MLGYLKSAAEDAFEKFRTSFPLNPFEVAEIPDRQLAQDKPVIFVVHSSVQKFTIYLNQNDKRYHVSWRATFKAKVYSLFRTPEMKEAENSAQMFNEHELLLSALDNEEQLRRAVNVIHTHPKWESIHVASHLNILKFFDALQSHSNYSKLIQAKTGDEVGKLPVHFAAELDSIELMERLLKANADPGATDLQGMTALHYASMNNVAMVQTICLYPASHVERYLNSFNSAGYTPLLLAIRAGKVECVKAVLRAGAQADLSSSGDEPLSPLAEAMRDSTRFPCIQVLIEAAPQLLAEPNPETGENLFHTSRDRKALNMFIDAVKHKVNVPDRVGRTALMSHVVGGRLDCVVCLFSYGADVNRKDDRGDTALHLAVKAQRLHVIKALLIFGADPNLLNNDGESVRHVAARTGQGKEIVECLKVAGAARCAQNLEKPCNSLCAYNEQSEAPPEYIEPNFLENFAQELAINRTKKLAESADGRKKMVNMLALDGGGIRGLVLVQILLAIEKNLKRPLIDYFDWVGGTSTGALLACAMAIGNSLRDCQRMYLRFKDSIFISMSRPYETAILEGFLKSVMGEERLMSEVEKPKLLLTTTLADKHPVKLKVLRNYVLPLGHAYGADEQMAGYDPKSLTVWKACRCSSAAPSYFTTVDGKFVDGGLTANNPVLELLCEVYRHNLAMQYLKEPDKVVEIGTVLSVGTGRVPEVPITSKLHIGLPDNPLEALNIALAVRDLGNLMVDQVTATEGAPLMRARSWAHQMGVPLFRLSPQLSKDIPLDTKDDLVLVQMLWECMVYVGSVRGQLAQVVELLETAKP